MLCMLTVRRLKPDAEKAFREAWAPDRWHGRMVHAYHLRSDDDPSQVITLGFFEGTEEELDAMRDDPAWMSGEERRPAADRAARGVRAPERRLERRRGHRARRPKAHRAAAAAGRRGGRAIAGRPGPRSPRAGGGRGSADHGRACSRACSAGCRPVGTLAFIAGGANVRRAASTSIPSWRWREIASSRCVLSMLIDPWRVASSRARISAERASADSTGFAARAWRGRDSGGVRPGARCRAARPRRRTTSPTAARGRRGRVRARPAHFEVRSRWRVPGPARVP